MITGFDFDPTMLGISAMNLMVHGIDNPDIIGQDTFLLTLLKIIQIKQ